MPRLTSSARLLLGAALSATLVAGCNEQEQPAEQPAGGTTTTPGTEDGQAPAPPAPTGREPDQEYTVRGEIRQLPDDENPASGLQIQHENIPDFVNKDGEVKGMRPMIMHFTPAPDLDLSALAVGDKISFTFDVDWDGAPLMLVTEIEPLPADTQLEFSAPPLPSGG